MFFQILQGNEGSRTSVWNLIPIRSLTRDPFCVGEVFHGSAPEQLSLDEARAYCEKEGAELATTGQLYMAWSEGLDRCNPGWLSDGSVRYPVITPRARCGGPQAGVKTLYRYSNQTGFPESSSRHDVYCFRGLSIVLD